MTTMAQANGIKQDGRALRWVRHREERTRKFVEITCDVVRKYGYQVSMDQIAEYAKTSKSILYRYFPDKISLQYTVGSYIVGDLVDRIKTAMMEETSPECMIKSAIDVYLDFMLKDLDLYIFVRIGDLEGEPGTSKLLNFDEVFLSTAVGTAVDDQLDHAHGSRLDANIGAGSTHYAAGTEGERRQKLVRSHIGSVALVSVIRSVAETWLFSKRILDRPEDYPDFVLDEADRLVAELSQDEIKDYIYACVEGGVLGNFR
ncbi:TetR/AcrR family transcriptional regulator [Arcanobacterium bovis]|uniref:TetR/AcrR family transcriptional regulator n=1 Tax=Arcanobacterium bovis TaxID=2529275 RepID=A0A4Q9UZL6_9ACTO|nr:TetR/AcrR family transcriptional regulator [Arcanobacterium bovis]TBW21440.1 TetR/AcrR family transcriptional regulator [Arcanobacterium bovis]